MGEPAYPTQAQIEKLRGLALQPPPEMMPVRDGNLELHLPPDGLVLIELP
jgi:xylan 1,4-beta-xylosidase